MKKLFIKTYGCQMNVYDSGRMTDLLAPHGYAPTSVPDDADLVILNTCHIREKAAEKVYSELGRIKQIKEDRAARGDETIVAVAGCVAQAEGEEIIRRAPVVSMVFGPQTYHRLPEMVAQATRQAGHVLDTDFPAEDKFDHLPAEVTVEGVTAFLTIQEGCDKFCTFCVVPYTRGAEFSRTAASIEAEARALVAKGAREITLLGQNVNAYHGLDEKGADVSLAALARRLSAVEGLQRLRYTTSHPRDMDDDLITAHGELDILMPYLHLPVQAGSDRILKAMNRGHTAAQYLALIHKIRAKKPDIALSGDFIVGFPGETESDFQATMNLVRDVKYASAFSFKYSPRPGTPGAAMNGHVPEEQKIDRLARLQELLNQQQAEFNTSQIGRKLMILVDKPGRRPGQVVGRSPYLQPVHFEGNPDLIGQTVEVEIISATKGSLGGQLVRSAAAA